MSKCKICNSSNIKIYIAKEMMFGFLDEFEYFQCLDCKCLQIKEVPKNIIKYYPSNYHKFNSSKKENPLVKFLKKRRDRYAFYKNDLIGKFINKKYSNKTLELIAETKVNKDSRILDVGSGNGKLLLQLSELGFKKILGIDPFIEKDLLINNHIKIKKTFIEDINGKWDLIIFNHSFEHIFNQLSTLQKVTNLLSNKGCCMLRIPTVSSYVWEKYGVNWVELDAPRHFFLHSVESLMYLASKANLEVEKVIYDSTAFEFWVSEQYLKGIPLRSEKSYSINNKRSIFTPNEIKQFGELAKKLNEEKRGGRAAFFLKKKSDLPTKVDKSGGDI